MDTTAPRKSHRRMRPHVHVYAGAAALLYAVTMVLAMGSVSDDTASNEVPDAAEDACIVAMSGR